MKNIGLSRDSLNSWEGLGFRDELLIQTKPLNDYFLANKFPRDMLLIVCAALMDLMIICSLTRWALYTPSWRFMIACVQFYADRFLIQMVWYIEAPPGYAWEYPGVMSLFVPYGRTADFFYSGHVGICMIHYMEYASIGWKWMSYYTLFVMIAQIFLMTVLRSHYSIDMAAGMVIAYWQFVLAEKYSYLVDWHIFGIPLFKRIRPAYDEEGSGFATRNKEGQGNHSISKDGADSLLQDPENAD